MKLIPISEHPDSAKILYQLLEERPEYANISHRIMPTWEEHLDHISRMRPRGLLDRWWNSHLDWCLIVDDNGPVGAIYLSCRYELGPAVLEDFQRRGFGEAACRAMMAKHSHRRYLWNVNPKNAASMRLAEKLGFKLVQHTYALEAE